MWSSLLLCLAFMLSGAINTKVDLALPGLLQTLSANDRSAETPVQRLIGEHKLHQEVPKVPPPADFERYKGQVHPFWEFDTNWLTSWAAVKCAIVLVGAGVLCSAGGIGGGGIYVTVLMVAGGLTVRDAVPLSKAVVFFGSLSSLVLNVRKASEHRSKETLIDYNVCRLVVPAALVGTYLGVFLNSILPSWAVLLTLTSILVIMCYMILETTWRQYTEEQASLSVAAAHIQDSDSDSEMAVQKGRGGKQRLLSWSAQGNGEASLRNKITSTDIVLAVLMLLLVVSGSTFRHHATECQLAPVKDRLKACHHPTISFWLEAETMSGWMQTPRIAESLKASCFAGPLAFCIAMLGWSGSHVVAKEGWSPGLALKFSVMAVITGCLAGLVGIGGGLIFSPYFLLMGMEPSVAVATSSTCVIFTSSSTTFQYLLADRIIMPLTVLYGVVNLFASYIGTSLVHHLQDHLSGRRSYISFIVSLGVVISTALAFRELVNVASAREAFPAFHDK